GYEDEFGDTYYSTDIELDNEGIVYSGYLSKNQFNSPSTLHDEKTESVDLFDFAYALTVHNAQGGQAKRVVLFEERFKNMDKEMWKRWLYTAITTASDELYIIG